MLTTLYQVIFLVIMTTKEILIKDPYEVASMSTSELVEVNRTLVRTINGLRLNFYNKVIDSNSKYKGRFKSMEEYYNRFFNVDLKTKGKTHVDLINQFMQLRDFIDSPYISVERIIKASKATKERLRSAKLFNEELASYSDYAEDKIATLLNRAVELNPLINDYKYDVINYLDEMALNYPEKFDLTTPDKIINKLYEWIDEKRGYAKSKDFRTIE